MALSKQNKIPWYDRIPLSIRDKMLIAFLGLTLVPMLLLGQFSLKKLEDSLKQQISRGLQVEAATAASAVEDYLSGVRRDVRSLARFLQRRLRDEMTADQWALVQNEFLQSVLAEKAYYQIRFVSAAGVEKLRINNHDGRPVAVPPSELQDKGDRYYVCEALQCTASETYLSHLDFNMEFGQLEIPHRLVVRVATPVVGKSGKTAGLVIINVFGEELLSVLEYLFETERMRVLLLNQGGRSIEMKKREGSLAFTSTGTDTLGGYLPAAKLLPQPGEKIDVADAGSDLMVIAPVNAGPGRLWHLVIVHPQKYLYTELIQLKSTIMFSVIILTILAVFWAMLGARTFSRPIRRLSRLAEAIAGGDFDKRCDITSHDELGQLSQALNEMAQSQKKRREELLNLNRNLQEEVERKVADLNLSRQEAEKTRQLMTELEKQLLQADRLSSLGMLSATVAHEIGNPLAGLRVRLQMLQRRKGLDRGLEADFTKMLDLVDRLGSFLGYLTGYVAPAQEQGKVQADIIQVLRDIGFILCEEAERKQIRLNLHLPDSPRYVCSPAQHLHQIFMNLMLNAVQACGKGGQVDVYTDYIEERVIVRICDNGSGLPEDLSERIFEPLVSSKPEGTGLGLAIVRQLVTELNGKVTLENKESGGVEARVCFADGGRGCSNRF